MAGREGGKPVEPSLVARVVAGVRYAITGRAPDDFFGPGDPLPPQAQTQAVGRAFDYPFSVNTQMQPRATEAIDFPTLRALAESYDILRLAIETRKDQMGKLRWSVVRKDGGKHDAKAKEIEAFLQEPDGEHDFLTWKRMLLEDLLVIDAATVYVRRTKGGQPFAFEVMDGATIKRILGVDGRTPRAPDAAYQQILKGMPAVEYSRDELLYKPRNPRPQKVYGYSPVEQIIMTVNIALRRQVSQLEYYTAGNIPDMFASVPATWTPAQIKEFQLLWDELLAGDTAARRRMKFMPGDMKLEKTQGEALFDPYDEWLSRVICYAFSLPPGAFVKQQNRATAESSQEIALEEGLSPLMEWDVRFMNRLITLGWQTSDYEFSWVKDLDVDPLIQSQIDVAYASAGIRRVNEIREDHGWEPDAELEALAMAPPPAPVAPGGAPADEAKAKAKDDATAAETKKIVDAIAELHAALMKAGAPTPPSITELAGALSRLVDSGIPVNVALKRIGLDIEPIDGGDVALVSASRVPLSIAGDPAALVPPVQKVEKVAPPAPAPIIITPAAVPAPNIEFKPEIHIHEAPRGGTSTVRITKPNGDVVAGEISHGTQES